LNWSPQRIADYQEALQQDAGDTLAVLRIPSRNIEVPVFNSTDEWALNRGSGHVTGTSLPGERGNIAIAAHRDGFFRSLENIEIGDEVELTTLEGHQTFRVSQLDIVDPLDVSVLEPTDDTMVTLITCYPFYYVGAAPDRFIVRAALTNKENNDENT
jgi:sortase A